MLYKRILYLGYYLKELDRKKFKRFMKYTIIKTGKSKTVIILDILKSILKYNISILEYFLFHFYEISANHRAEYVGTGFIYEYQLSMNPKSSRSLLSDKIEFLNHYKNFVRHGYITLSMLENDPATASSILNNDSGKIVLKNASGQCGTGIEVLHTKDLTPRKLIERLKDTKNNLVEEFVEQHDDLMKLSSSGLNTIRLITQLTKDNHVTFLGARIRITVNSSVDNLAAGNLAAPIDLNTGLVNGPAVYSDITKPEEIEHPITKTKIINFKVPFWKETIEMVEQAALISKGNRSIGWDVAITDSGPELIEGNHNWCKLLWQLPVKKGLKSELVDFL